MTPRRVLVAIVYIAATALFWALVGYALGLRPHDFR
jgi:hypothetical protein